MQTIRRAGYLLVVLIAAALTTAFVWRPAPPAHFTGLKSVHVPVSVDGYTGRDLPVDDMTKNALQSAEIMYREYKNPAGQRIDLSLIGGTDRSALHDPRSCLVGADWKIDNDRVEVLNVDGSSVPARTCVATKTGSGTGNLLAYDIVYLYVTHRKVIASATEIRMALLENALLEQNDAPVYFIRLITPLAHGQSSADEHAGLMRFASDFWRSLAPTVLKEERA